MIAGDAKPSSKLKVAGRHIWNAIAPELSRLNILRATDGTALSRYCDDLATYWEVTEQLRVEGLTYEVNSLHGQYKRVHPLVAIQDRLAARLVSMEDRFGLTPQSRQQLMIRAAQLVSQGNLFGNQAEPHATAPAEATDPVGFLGSPPTQH